MANKPKVMVKKEAEQDEGSKASHPSFFTVAGIVGMAVKANKTSIKSTSAMAPVSPLPTRALGVVSGPPKSSSKLFH